MTINVRLFRNIAATLAALIVLIFYILWRQWQIRDSIDDICWPTAAIATESGDAVTATWLGITTVLFDDGETQILIDGTFTRPSPLQIALLRPVKSDIATIDYALSAYRMDRLAAIVPTHSHFDHAMDVGHLANRTSAVILGSESTANIARGQNVPVDQYQTLADGESRQFGAFTIKLIASNHAPIGFNNQEFFAGVIDEPLLQPARVSAWKTGVAWSVLVSHPRGTTLVQASGGFVEGKLANEAADVVMLGVAGLARLGRQYTEELWDQTVTATHAARVIGMHHDDFTAPFGEVRLLPNMLDNVVKTAGWLDEINEMGGSDVTIEKPPFGQPMVLY
jgi:L-ascorbate metabolism protein UlaG (beta-lactamase superfamily)